MKTFIITMDTKFSYNKTEEMKYKSQMQKMLILSAEFRAWVSKNFTGRKILYGCFQTLRKSLFKNVWRIRHFDRYLMVKSHQKSLTLNYRQKRTNAEISVYLYSCIQNINKIDQTPDLNVWKYKYTVAFKISTK